MKKEVKFPQIDNPFYIANNGFFSQWCCGCGLRHIWHFKMYDHPKEGKYIEISVMQDDKGTELRKKYQKLNK